MMYDCYFNHFNDDVDDDEYDADDDDECCMVIMKGMLMITLMYVGDAVFDVDA